jgi:hypothetical protein
MTTTVQQKIEQTKQKKYAYQWDIYLKAVRGLEASSFDQIIIACADIFDRLSAGPPLQRPPYLGRGGQEIYAVDFSLTNAWGNGLFFHFYNHTGNPRDGYRADLWCEFVGIVDTRVYIERSASVYYRLVEDMIVTVEPSISFFVSIATNQSWDWQQIIWHCVRERFEKEGYDDETLGLQARVKLFDTVQELKETEVFAKLVPASKEKIMHNLNHPTSYDMTYFQLCSDRYIDLDETITALKDPGRIHTINISSLALAQIPHELVIVNSLQLPLFRHATSYKDKRKTAPNKLLSRSG